MSKTKLVISRRISQKGIGYYWNDLDYYNIKIKDGCVEFDDGYGRHYIRKYKQTKWGLSFPHWTTLYVREVENE